MTPLLRCITLIVDLTMLFTIQVTATDSNRGQNGKLEYSINSIKELDDNQEKTYFRINSTTGTDLTIDHNSIPNYQWQVMSFTCIWKYLLHTNKQVFAFFSRRYLHSRETRQRNAVLQEPVYNCQSSGPGNEPVGWLLYLPCDYPGYQR